VNRSFHRGGFGDVGALGALVVVVVVDVDVVGVFTMDFCFVEELSIIFICYYRSKRRKNRAEICVFKIVKSSYHNIISTRHQKHITFSTTHPNINIVESLVR